MILKALYDYYYRCIDNDPNSLPIYGTMNAQISFIIVIDKEGNYVGLEDSRLENGKGKTYVLPIGVHTNAITPFLFWDNCQYALDYSIANKPLSESDAIDPKKKQKWEKTLAMAHKKHEAFVAKCLNIANETQDESFIAVSKFYAKNQLTNLMASKDWELIKANPTANVSFRILGETRLVANSPKLIKYVETDSTENGICLITGKKGSIIRKATPTPIVGCNASASLVSFQEDSGYDSYGKEKAYNAPILVDAEFAFSTALKRLKEPDSRNKFTINDRLYIYFSSEKNAESEQMEDFLYSIFGRNDDPNSNLESVRRKVRSIFNGKNIISDNTYFYIIGIAPNLGREAIVYYSEIPLFKFAEKLDRHFEDMNICVSKWEKPYYGLFEILRSVVLKGDVRKNCPPNLPDAIVKSIFEGFPYPYTLFSLAIRRIRAEQDVAPYGNPCRMAIIKAYLNRLNDNNKKLEVMLDKENTNPGYLCGRLFAVLENLQYAANGQDSIRSSYMNAASSTPSAVFSTVLKLSNTHYGKLAKDKKGLAIFFDKQKEEILHLLSDFPDTLELQDQGRFFIGYYHQKNYKENNQE